MQSDTVSTLKAMLTEIQNELVHMETILRSGCDAVESKSYAAGIKEILMQVGRIERVLDDLKVG